MLILKEMIQTLCLDGVEYKPLGELCERQKGIAITAGEMKKLDKSNAPIRIFAAGHTVVNVEYGDISNSGIITKPSIVVKSRGNIGFEFYAKPFTHKNEMWSYSAKTELIELKFVYYYLQCHIDEFQLKAKTGKLPQISTGDTDNYKIPVPPIEVQREIVRILDTFTDLQQCLQEELTARKKQYAYYRDELLNAEESIKNVEYRKLRDVCGIVDYRGKTPKKTEKGVFLITAKNIRKGYIDYEKSKEYISPQDYKIVMRRGMPQIGDVLITTEAPCGNVAQVDREDIALAQRVIKYRPNSQYLNSTYLKYILLDKEFQEKLQSAATGGTVKGIKGSRLHQLTIPVPPLEEQERIVFILNRFDKLCNDLTEGIPAEIEARKKQYEYYRDKLLNFKEKAG